MKTWQRPAAVGQEFAANDYVSACNVTVKCDYWPEGLNRRIHYQLLVPDEIEGFAGDYYGPCEEKYTYKVNASDLHPVTFEKDDWGADLGASYTAYYWVAPKDDGTADFHVSSISESEYLAAMEGSKS